MPALSAPGRRLALGNLVAYLDDDGSFLRAISVRGEEILRGIGFVVRDRHWGTYKLQSEPEIERRTAEIVVRAAGRVAGPDGMADWSLSWTLRPNGLSGSCDCTSAAGFATNRTGFVILHSLPATRGQRVAITHAEGPVEQSCFPDLVSPHQPFMDVAAMEHATAAGHRVRLRFAGEVFETEDQRNWTDASYKTYSRPLAKPFPYRITASAPERQQVDLDLLRVAPPPAQAADAPVVLRETVMPPLGVGVSPGAPAAGLGDVIGRLAPAFTAIEIDLARDPMLAQTSLLLASVPGAVRLDIRKAHPDVVLCALQTLAPLLGGRDVIGLSLWEADERLIEAARAIMPPAPIGSGTGAFFTELNRGTDWPAGADYLTWTSTPTYHGSTDDTLGESVEPLPDILRTAKATWPGRRFQIGPHTLGMRFNPNAAAPDAPGRRCPSGSTPGAGNRRGLDARHAGGLCR